MVCARWLAGAGSALAFLVWLAPALAALADVGGWFFGLGSVSGVQWTDARQVFAVLWSLLSPMVWLPLGLVLAEVASPP